MLPQSDYELLDFGMGRKLERFGQAILDRPSPAALQNQKSLPQLWNDATARFELSAPEQTGKATTSATVRGTWQFRAELPVPWLVRFDRLAFELKPTDFGHVGLFPEQAENWHWIGEQVRCLIAKSQSSPVAALPTALNSLHHELPARLAPRVLNLFAYTGASTLAAAVAGAQVTHVDSARNTVAWARKNSEHSGLVAAPIRWITEDAVKFVERRVKRGELYDGLILDPPSYGHGPAGETWKIDEHLPNLLSLCRKLMSPQLGFVLLTAHAPGYDAERLAECLVSSQFVHHCKEIECGEMRLRAADGRSLHAGSMARISAQ